MEYISTTNAAEKWGVSLRQVQRLLAANRIPGAKRYGRLWMAPADAHKPGDPRKKNTLSQKPLLADLTRIIAATTLPMPRANPDAILETITEERLRLQYRGELAYLRGDFTATKHCFHQTEGDSAARLRASSVAIAAAISLGDYPFYQEVETFLTEFVSTKESDEITAIAELNLSTAYVSAGALNMVPAWLKDGDFSALITQARPDAAYKRAKYFQFLGQPESMLAISQTALELCKTKSEISFHCIYFRVLCAIACCTLRRFEEANCWLREALNIALPLGFITPFAESATAFGGLLESCLKQEYPQYYEIVTKQWECTFTNWLTFHNRFTKDNITLILSLRDYQIAQLAARGVPYKKIADQFQMSVGTLKNKMQVIYEMLFIYEKHRRKELIKYIL